VIEGSSDGEEWREYAFRYKPGDVSRRPPWNSPPSAAAGLQMWFAALEDPRRLGWFTRFLEKLLKNEPAVTAVLEETPSRTSPRNTSARSSTITRLPPARRSPRACGAAAIGGTVLPGGTPEGRMKKEEHMTSHRDIPGSLLAMLGCLAIVQTAYGAAPVAADEIRGTVMSARGPEAASGSLPRRTIFKHDSPRSSSPTMPAAISFRICRRRSTALGTRLWSRGLSQVRRDAGTRIGYQGAHGQGCGDGATIYPAAYWYAMMKIPEEAQVAALAGGRNGYLMWMKNMGCVGCHHLGNLATRTIPESLGSFKSSQEAWLRRLQSGPGGRPDDQHRAGHAGRNSNSLSGGLTDRIAAGEVPAAQPARPSGVERNIVATVRDWSDRQGLLARSVGNRSRHPSVNAYAGCKAPRN